MCVITSNTMFLALFFLYILITSCAVVVGHYMFITRTEHYPSPPSLNPFPLPSTRL